MQRCLLSGIQTGAGQGMGFFFIEVLNCDSYASITAFKLYCSSAMAEK